MTKPIIRYFTLEEIKILSLKILASDFFSKYFSCRQLCDKIIVDKFNIPERYLFTPSEYSPLQKFIKKQLNHSIRSMKSLGYIKKHSNRFWLIDKEKIKKDLKLLIVKERKEKGV